MTVYARRLTWDVWLSLSVGKYVVMVEVMVFKKHL